MIIKSLSLILACALSAFPLISSATTGAYSKTHHEAKLSQDVAHILGFLIVLNKNEIAAAHLAEAKTTNTAVKNYAALMVQDHGKNLRKTEALGRKLHIKPIEGPAARKMQAKGMHELKQLKRLKEAFFDKAYINAMVKGHTKASNEIANLMQQVSNPTVKKHLEATEKHVNQHLAKASSIQKELR